jgi:hypothetical protein
MRVMVIVKATKESEAVDKAVEGIRTLAEKRATR